ncbi:hypothetical protein H072_4692 [Dactylellina haptotyla CBS 200.50]|uniref:SP-RING-type domain-containing protein n=1 Tax=Dactylellina haptotyla (strain CBS 200.50) TaxID=1284197 RepID=S8BPN4_DACHA|nr:hypothetical protein H072_4692 [Dactylellina haptotyla CBS 200.50]
MESNRPLHDTNRGSDVLQMGQVMRVDTSASLGHPGRPPLTSPLKRKSSISRHDINLTNVNNTASMFMGGRRHSWMQEGAIADAYAPRMPPLKRVKTTPSRTTNAPIVKGDTPIIASVPSSASTVPSDTRPPEPKELTAHIVITIPDTQLEEQEDLSQPSAITSTKPLQCSNSTSVSSPPTTARSTPDSITPAPSVHLTHTPSRNSPSSSIAPIAGIQQNPANPMNESRASPIGDAGSSHYRRTPFTPRSSVESVSRIRPTVQTTVSPYLQNMTPPPSTSPVSATVISGVSDLGLRSAHPNTAMPSPLASPQMSEPSTIDVPKYLSDGTCQMHTVNLRNASIEDHNLVLGDLQRLGQQIKDSAIPNRSLVARYSKLIRALDIIRRQINQTSVQTTSELVSDILRRLTPTRQTQPHGQGNTTLLQAASLASQNMTSPANQHISTAQDTAQPQSFSFLTPTMRPPPQPNNQQSQIGPSTGYFRPTLSTLGNSQHPQIPNFSHSNLVRVAPIIGHIATSPIHHNVPQLPSIHSQLAQPTTQIPQYQAQQVPAPGSASTDPQKTFWCGPYLSKLHYHMRQSSAEPWQPNDTLRANLLESAFKQGDDLFVALHLIFCTSDHPSLQSTYAFICQDSRNKLGLELLSQLLFPNSTLSARALGIFSQVPFELGASRLNVPGFNQSFVAALKLLQNIRPLFDSLYNFCLSNKLACPSQLNMIAYGITSPSLQRTIIVSLSQMLKNHRISQAQQPAQVSVTQQSQLQARQAAARQYQNPYTQQARQHASQHGSPKAATSSSKPAPIERPDFHVFTTEWGSKLPGWKLIPEWRHIPADLEKPQGDESDYLTYFKRCITDVIKIESVRTQNISFVIDEAINKSLPKVSRAEGTALNTRPVGNWSKLYRLRCVASTTDLTESTGTGNFAAWRSCDTNWPPNFFAELNDKLNRAIDRKQDAASVEERELSKKRKLHFRRKRNWGKDCATDLTDGLEPGENTIQLMMLDPPLQDGSSYYLAVEEVEIADTETLLNLISKNQVVSAQDSREIITSRLKRSADAMADDDDIAVVEEDTVIVSITCPMSQQLIDIPVRGKDCKHLDCFDLKGYLTSRTKLCPGFSVPDSWKCPICSCECTPATLTVDGFMQETIARLRGEQAQGNFLDTKSVVIRADGMWRPNEPLESMTTKIKKEEPEVICLLDDD